MTTCECDYDCVGDPLRYERCNYSILCPEHDMCCSCDERLAVEIVDGDKLCKECLKELAKEREADEALVRSLRHTR